VGRHGALSGEPRPPGTTRWRRVRDDVGDMSEPSVPDGRGEDDGSGDVLRNLPRTRPQRPSARRTHATPPATTDTAASSANGASASPAETGPAAPAAPKRQAAKAPRAKRPAGAKATPKAGTAKPTAKAGARSTAKTTAKITAGTGRRRAAGAAKSPRASSGAPQGFEAEANVPVDPPGAADVLDAALGTAGDLVQSGLELGGRAVRGALSRLLGG